MWCGVSFVAIENLLLQAPYFVARSCYMFYLASPGTNKSTGHALFRTRAA